MIAPEQLDLLHLLRSNRKHSKYSPSSSAHTQSRTDTDITTSESIVLGPIIHRCKNHPPHTNPSPSPAHPRTSRITHLTSSQDQPTVPRTAASPETIPRAKPAVCNTRPAQPIVPLNSHRLSLPSRPPIPFLQRPSPLYDGVPQQPLPSPLSSSIPCILRSTSRYLNSARTDPPLPSLNPSTNLFAPLNQKPHVCDPSRRLMKYCHAANSPKPTTAHHRGVV